MTTDLERAARGLLGVLAKLDTVMPADIDGLAFVLEYRAALDALRAALPAEGAAGAVAWLLSYTDDAFRTATLDREEAEAWAAGMETARCVPLYAHPAPADAAPLATIRRVLNVAAHAGNRFTATPADVAEVRAWLDGRPAPADAGAGEDEAADIEYRIRELDKARPGYIKRLHAGLGRELDFRSGSPA